MVSESSDPAHSDQATVGRPPWQPTNPSEIIVLYRSGMSAGSLAHRFDVSTKAVRNFLLRNGVPMRRRGETLRKDVSAETLSTMVGMYKSGRTIDAIAEHTAVSASLVRRHLLAAGVAIRSRGDHRNAVLGQDIIQDVVCRFDAKQSVNRISYDLGIKRSTVNRLLRENGRAPRTRSEAEALKWSQMPQERREAQVHAAHATVRGSLKDAAWHARQTKARAELLHKTAESELVFANLLRQRGLAVSLQAPIVDRYNADIAVECVAVEIHSAQYLQPGRADQIERTFRILDAGWNILVVTTYRTPIRPGCADNLVGWIEELRRNPSACRQYRVVNGTGQLRAIYELNSDGLTPIFSARGRSHVDREYTRPRQ